jgi:hypothetical protein
MQLREIDVTATLRMTVRSPQVDTDSRNGSIKPLDSHLLGISLGDEIADDKVSSEIQQLLAIINEVDPL